MTVADVRARAAALLAGIEAKFDGMRREMESALAEQRATVDEIREQLRLLIAPLAAMDDSAPAPAAVTAFLNDFTGGLARSVH